MTTYTLEQAQQLKKENSALIDVLYKRFMGQARQIIAENPLSDVPGDLAKVQRVLDKAYKRSERRTEIYADIKWPFRHGSNAAAALGSMGGKSTSEAKRKASAENGKRGGRPTTKK
jgi:hypothetical protein